MPDRVEVDSDGDDEEDDDDDNSSDITGLPGNNASTTKNALPAVNTPPRNVPPEVSSNRPSDNTLPRNMQPVHIPIPPKDPPTSSTRTEPQESNILVPTPIPR